MTKNVRLDSQESQKEQPSKLKIKFWCTSLCIGGKGTTWTWQILKPLKNNINETICLSWVEKVIIRDY